jgi:excisionase family DNA binding protein
LVETSIFAEVHHERFQFEPIAATAEEAEQAREVWRSVCGENNAVSLRVVREGKTAIVPLPAPAVKLLVQALDNLAEGNEVAVVPVLRELTTPEAARLMKVSRQFLARAVDKGMIRGRKVGKHRRIRLADALSWVSNS